MTERHCLLRTCAPQPFTPQPGTAPENHEAAPDSPWGVLELLGSEVRAAAAVVLPAGARRQPPRTVPPALTTLWDSCLRASNASVSAPVARTAQPKTVSPRPKQPPRQNRSRPGAADGPTIRPQAPSGEGSRRAVFFRRINAVIPLLRPARLMNNPVGRGPGRRAPNGAGRRRPVLELRAASHFDEPGCHPRREHISPMVAAGRTCHFRLRLRRRQTALRARDMRGVLRRLGRLPGWLAAGGVRQLRPIVPDVRDQGGVPAGPVRASARRLHGQDLPERGQGLRLTPRRVWRNPFLR